MMEKGHDSFPEQGSSFKKLSIPNPKAAHITKRLWSISGPEAFFIGTMRFDERGCLMAPVRGIDYWNQGRCLFVDST